MLMGKWKNWSSTRSIAILLLALAAPAMRGDDRAYFVNPSGLFGIIDLNTGAFTTLGTGSTNASAGLGALGGALYAANYSGSELYSVNPASGALSAIGSSSIVYYGLGSTTTGLYAVGYPTGKSSGPFNLYSINPANGASTLIGPLGAGLGPFAATSLSVGSATLYFADNNALYSINTQTGAATQIGMTNAVIGAMVYENGTLYGGVNSCGSTPCVWSLSPGSGNGTFVANTNISGNAFAGLAPITPLTSSQILPQLAFGAGWYSALYFTNTSSATVSFTVSFFSDNGTALIIPSIGVSSTTVNLAPQATTLLEALNMGTLTQGYVTAALPAGVIGYGVFRQSVPGIADQEAVVPLSSANSTSSTLVWDDTNLATSVAIANPSAGGGHGFDQRLG